MSSIRQYLINYKKYANHPVSQSELTAIDIDDGRLFIPALASMWRRFLLLLVLPTLLLMLPPVCLALYGDQEAVDTLSKIFQGDLSYFSFGTGPFTLVYLLLWWLIPPKKENYLNSVAVCREGLYLPGKHRRYTHRYFVAWSEIHTVYQYKRCWYRDFYRDIRYHPSGSLILERRPSSAPTDRGTWGQCRFFIHPAILKLPELQAELRRWAPEGHPFLQCLG